MFNFSFMFTKTHFHQPCLSSVDHLVHVVTQNGLVVLGRGAPTRGPRECHDIAAQTITDPKPVYPFQTASSCVISYCCWMWFIVCGDEAFCPNHRCASTMHTNNLSSFLNSDMYPILCVLRYFIYNCALALLI